MPNRCDFCTSSSTKDKQQWTQCDGCDRWVHDVCVSITDPVSYAKYHCPTCTKTKGPSLYKRQSKRKKIDIDYAAMHSGNVDMSLRTRHVHSSRFTDVAASAQNKEPFKRVSGTELTLDWAQSSDGLNEPVIVPKEYKDTLGMYIPEDLTVRQVAEAVGMESPVEVINVVSQNGSPGWNMGKWTEYYEDIEGRDTILNVISLEISASALGKTIVRPTLVRELDLVDRVWPTNSDAARESKPRVSLYALMSVEDSFTDFHIDFAGSSVFYHVLKGRKSFMFIRPTARNLAAYSQWCLSADQNVVFLPDVLSPDSDIYTVHLSPGDTMYIPSGWIHAVHSPQDSLVVGGNFITPLNMKTQIDIAGIEVRTKVPMKFRYPLFAGVMWYYVLQLLANPERLNTMSTKERDGLNSVAEYLSGFIKTMSPTMKDVQYRRFVANFPMEIRPFPGKTLLDYCAMLDFYPKGVQETVDIDIRKKKGESKEKHKIESQLPEEKILQGSKLESKEEVQTENF
ncbi:YALIA101S03e13476g1_1 [Yarrowia lipolytica]|nr:JmjC domain-containing histone demethylation protein 1 [Yarrowia lipolytica]SEI33237.1 YALIA101S03e13476g1_1 [Yarrowia lipolytica]